MSETKTQNFSAESTHTWPAWARFIERLESGDIDEDIKRATTGACEHVAKQVRSLVDHLSGTPQAACHPSSEEPEVQLENAYQELQCHLIQVRQAVAQAIATEKQLEQQLSKNRDQATTWQARVNAAVDQGNQDLAAQARQRQMQYEHAAAHLEEQLGVQRQGTSALRQRLIELEEAVQKTYTQKQVLVARYKAALATARANAIMAKVGAGDALSVIARMEERVSEREAAAVAAAELAVEAATAAETQPDYQQILLRAVTALEHATTVIERMEKLVAASEEKIH